MTTRRRLRPSRPRAQSAHGSRFTTYSLIAFMLLCGVGYVISAMFLGNMVADKFIKKQSPAPASTVKVNAPLAATATPGPEKATTRVTLPGFQAYALQLGAYASRASAETSAQEWIQRGGAGYILESDGRYRVFASAYPNQEDARTVQRQLSAQGVESILYTFEASEAGLNLSASATTAASFRASVEGLLSWMNSYGDLAVQLEMNKLTLTECAEASGRLLADMQLMRAPLEAIEPGNPLFDKLLALFTRCCDAAKQSSEGNGQTQLAMLANIRYNYLDLLNQYQTYMRALN